MQYAGNGNSKLYTTPRSHITGSDFLSDVHFADLVYFGSAHSTYCACANAMCFLRVFGGNYSICLSWKVHCFIDKVASSSIAGDMPRRDPSSFSAQSGRSLILDPGVSASLCFLAQSSLPDPGLLLSLLLLLPCHELSDALHDGAKCLHADILPTRNSQKVILLAATLHIICL